MTLPNVLAAIMCSCSLIYAMNDESPELRSIQKRLAGVEKTELEILRLVHGIIDGRHGGKVNLSIKGTPGLGNPIAKVAIVEFSDYQCPFCAAHARNTFKEIDNTYISSGKIRYFSKIFH